MSQKAVTEAITDLKVHGLQQAPLFANSIEECTDTTKLYVLPDGYIYAYMLTEMESGPSYTNQLPLAVNSSGGEYVGDNGEDGYRVGYRVSSSGTEKAATGYSCTGFIPAVMGDVVRIKNIPLTVSDGNGYCMFYYFNASYSKVSGGTGMYTTVTPNSDGVFEHTIPDVVGDGGAYFRVTLIDMTADTIITVNEEITEGGNTTTVYTWSNTGHAFVPADYEERIIFVETKSAEHTTKIAALEKAVETGGADETETAALNRIKNWKYPIHEDAPVFLLETDKPAIGSDERTTDAIYAKYDALMAEHSHYITKQDCGMASDDTTPIYVYHFKESEPHYENNNWSETKPVILVCSGVHPTEQSGVWSIYYAMEEIATNTKLRDLRRNVHFIVMPMINPTAFSDSTYGVRNPDGVQVHYNFEVDFGTNGAVQGDRNYGGETPLSIPETQYFDALMQEYKDTLACVLSCHNYDVDTRYGTGFMWASCATHFMCNLGFRLADKLSAAWREKHGTEFDEGVRWANEYALSKMAEGSSLFPSAVEQAEWDYRVGMASISGSGGTEYKQALKYGVHGINVEVCSRCMVLDRDFSTALTSNVTTMGCETYVNFFRTFMAVYDPKSKKEYAPNLPWRE